MQEHSLRSAMRGVVHDTYVGFLAFTKNGLALVGFTFVVILTVVFLRAESIPALKNFSFGGLTGTSDSSSPPTAMQILSGAFNAPAEQLGILLGLHPAPEVEEAATSEASGEVNDATLLPQIRTALASPSADNEGKARQAISRYLTRKYRLSNDAVELVISGAYEIGRDMDLEPTLLLAVMAIESRFNPFAESVMGAQGLMQVMTRIHREKFDEFGGMQAALNPVANMKVGALILKDCIRRGGSIERGLGLYVGAGMGDDRGYGAKVLQEKARIVAAAGGTSVRQVTASARPTTPAPEPATSMSVAPEIELMLEQMKSS